MFKNIAYDGGRNISRHRILEELKKRDLSQRQFSDLLLDYDVNISKNAISKIINGERAINDIEVKAIAECLGISTDELLSI